MGDGDGTFGTTGSVASNGSEFVELFGMGAGENLYVARVDTMTGALTPPVPFETCANSSHADVIFNGTGYAAMYGAGSGEVHFPPLH